MREAVKSCFTFTSLLSFEQVVKMMMIVVMVFGVCWLPYQGRDSIDIKHFGCK